MYGQRALELIPLVSAGLPRSVASKPTTSHLALGRFREDRSTCLLLVPQPATWLQNVIRPGAQPSTLAAVDFDPSAELVIV